MTRRASTLVACCLLPFAFCLLTTPAGALDIKLWPLIDYHSDPAGQRSLHLFGPLFAYETGPGGMQLTLRPLFSFTRGQRRAQNEFTLLYPLFVSRWAGEQTEYSVLGLISYVAEPAPVQEEWDSSFTIFPFVFYRHSPTLGTQLSVLPFYADLRDFFGFERVQMIAFPLYLHLEEPLRQRTWLPFPFVSWVGGTLGRGFRVFPFYGWSEDGLTERSAYVMWPFYISQDLHFTRPEREHRLIVFPFYASIDSATTQSRSYLVPFFTHTIDRKERTETWGFPWPFWLSQRNLDTGERTALRLAPFFGDTHIHNLDSHFLLWPAYRWSRQDVSPDANQSGAEYHRTRTDLLLVLYRDIDEAQPEYHHRRHWRTLFPLFRASDDDGTEEFASLALLDALLPRNPTVQRLYAPLWQIFTQHREPDQPPRWSLLWDLVSSDGARVRYPLSLDLSE